MIRLIRPENRICKNCGKEFLAKRNTYGLFCSHVCVGHSTWEKGLQYNRGSWLGRKHTDEWKKMMSDKFKGRNRTFTETDETRKRRSESRKEWWADKKRPVSKRIELNEIRNSLEMKAWKREVLKRDHYSCRMCGKNDKDLHVHHIMSFAECPEVMSALDNGYTVCPQCHRDIHSKKIILFSDLFIGEVVKNNTVTITLAHA